MNAAYITRTGPPDVIQYGSLPDPKPGATQCLIKVGAMAVNPIDTYIRGGLIPAELSFPFVIGCDLAGTIVDTGPAVRQFKPGDRVWGTNQGLFGRQGTFSELACVDEKWLYPTPQAASDQQAAALALVGMTAHLGLMRCARLQRGESLFVPGGSGGVGSAVVQIAKALGAKVMTTAGTDEKAALCRKLGADVVVNYNTEEVDGGLRAFAPEGINVWWETQRQPDFERAVPMLARRGRMILMAGREARPVFPVGPFYVKDCSLFGFAMFNASPEEQAQCATDINQWVQSGKLRARIDRVLPLAKAAEAHQLQEENTIGKAGTLAGKIVLTP